MLSDLFAGVADTLISYTIDKLSPTESVKPWLQQELTRLALQKSLARTYAAFARQYPDYILSLFDISFLGNEAVAELSKLLTRDQHPDPAIFAQKWKSFIGDNADSIRTATKLAAYFLELLETEIRSEPALQTILNAQAPERMSEKAKLTTELKRQLDSALKTAFEYEKVTLRIEGDVRDSNIFVGDNNQLTINKYYYSGDFVSLNEYYIPPDGVFQRVRVDEFVGRDWLTAKVDTFLNDPSRKSGAILLVGAAGVGKTAFMAHLVKERRYLHLFAEQVRGQAMLQRALQSLGSQLVTRYQIAPYQDRDTLNTLAGFPDFLERLLRLATNNLSHGEKIIIVCDALDEAGTFPDGNVFGLPNVLPDGVYLILSQRPVSVKLPNFEPVIEKLEAQSEGNLQDIEAYLSAVAKRPAVAGQIRAKVYSENFFIQILKEKSQGVWMYLHYIIKEIENGSRAPLDLNNLPTGLVGYYAEYWSAWRRKNKRGEIAPKWIKLYGPLLATLAAAQEAIPAEQLIEWADIKAKPYEVTSLLTESWRAFITEKDADGSKTYSPYHLSFKDFITGSVDINKLPTYEANLVRDLAAQTIDAHKRIGKALEAKCNGRWEILVEQDYLRLHLTTHLARALEYRKLIDLLTEGDKDIVWAKAREKQEGTFAGYLNDLTHAWTVAERERDYALAIRNLLIENSIHSIASNIPPILLSELAKTGKWSYARCLSSIRQKSVSAEKAECLELIMVGMPRILLQDAFVIASEIKEEDIRVRAWCALTPYLSEKIKEQLLIAVNQLGEESNRASILAALAPYLSDELRFRVLTAVHDLQDESQWGVVLSALVTLPNGEVRTSILESVLTAARKIRYEADRARALTAIASHLNDPLKTQIIEETIAITREIRFEVDRARIFAAIAPYLSGHLKTEVLDELLIAWREIKEQSIRIFLLPELAPYFSEELKSQALVEAQKIAAEHDRVYVLSALVPHLSDELKTQAVAQALEINDEFWRARAFSSLVPYLNGELNTQILAAAREIEFDAWHADVLAALIPYINNESKTQVLAATHGFKQQVARLTILLGLARDPGEELKMQILEEVRQLKGHGQVVALSTLAPHLNKELRVKVLEDALATTHEIGDESDRSNVLSAFAPYLSEKLQTSVLEIAQEFEDEGNLATVLCALAPFLSEELKHHVFRVGCAIKNEHSRATILSGFAPYLSEDLKTQMIAAVPNIKGQYSRATVLCALAPYLSKEYHPQMLVAARECMPETPRILIALAPFLSQELKIDLLAIAREIHHEADRAYTLAALAHHLRDGLRTEAIEESLAVAHKIEDELHRARILSALAPQLAREQKLQVFAAALEIKGEDYRAKVLVALAPYLDDELRRRVLVDTRNIQDVHAQVSVLSALSPDLNDELKKEALAVLSEMKYEFFRARALAALAPFLSDELKTRFVVTAREIADKADRARILSALAPYLDGQFKTEVLEEALLAARELKYESARTEILIGLATQFNRNVMIEIFQQALFETDNIKEILTAWEKIEYEGLEKVILEFLKLGRQRNRREVLKRIEILIPAFTYLAGKDIIPDILRTVTDVTRWWP